MVKRGTTLPKRLKNDAIIEALLEIRFESKTFFEVFLGRLVDHPYWKGLQKQELPAYSIPAQLRLIDPNMRYAPILELRGSDDKSALRIGRSVVSYHRRAPYDGWEKFKPELERVIVSLFAAAENVSVKRIGLRYMNALTPQIHFIGSISDLDLKLEVSGDPILGNVNINFTTNVGDESSCTVRIATREFTLGNLPQDTSLFVDVDVFTNEGYTAVNENAIKEWIEFAHTQEKTEFFRLFKQESIDKLRED